jgi:protein FAM50
MSLCSCNSLCGISSLYIHPLAPPPLPHDADSPESGPKKRFTKNPNVDTSFLPDRHREESERIERELLRQKWLAEQERIKAEPIEITYSFWDGSGHRKVVEVKKGDDIACFLGKCRAQFPELRATSVENMMYIKVGQGLG